MALRYQTPRGGPAARLVQDGGSMKPLLAALAALAFACSKKPPPPPPAEQAVRVVTEDVLARAPATNHATVKHILLGWDDLMGASRPDKDARAMARTFRQTEQLALQVFQRARGGEDFDKLIEQYSEDLASARVLGSYEVRPDGKMEPSFQALALRLNEGEIGVCVTRYGFHIVKRVK